MWHQCVLLAAVCSLPLSTGDSEDVQVVCVGKEFRLPVYSVSRVVTFTPSSPPGPRRVLLDKNDVKDSRFQWTRDRMLVLTGVSHSDQGLYSIKLSSGFTYETVRLSVSECITPFRRRYGETFQHILPQDASVLEFTPRGWDPDAPPLVLWNRSDPEVGVSSLQGRVQDHQGGQAIWVVPGVTQKDHQGNYTARDHQQRVLWRGDLTVHGHTSNVTRFTQESVRLRLLLPLSQSHLIFTPAQQEPEQGGGGGGAPPGGPFDLRPPRGPVALLTAGRLEDRLDLRYRGRVSVAEAGVTISRLTVLHDGMYDVRDQDGNLVSSTTLTVVDRAVKWRAVLKSISVPSGLFVSLAGFILFLKRYPQCSLAYLIRSLTVNSRNANATAAAATGTPRKWTPRASPAHMRYTPVIVTNGSPASHHDAHRPANGSTASQHDAHRPTNGSPASQHDAHRPANSSPALQRDAHRPNNDSPAPQSISSEKACDDGEDDERLASFRLPGATDCLRSSSECVRFHIDEDAGLRNKTPQSFLPLSPQQLSALPLDTDTSDSCSVFTSHKLSLS